MGDKVEVAPFGNHRTAFRNSSLSATSGVTRRRSAVVDRLRRRIEIFRGSRLASTASDRRRANSGPDFRPSSSRHPYHNSQSPRDLGLEQTPIGDDGCLDQPRLPTTMLTDSGCWTTSGVAASADPTSMLGGTRWAPMRDGRSGLTAAASGIDVRQWQSVELSSPSASSSSSSKMPGTSPAATPHHHPQQPSTNPFDSCSMPQAPAYDVSGGQRVGNSAMTSPRVAENSTPVGDSGSAAGSATVSVSIVHSLDSSCLYNQAKGEIKLTFSSTLSAPVAPQPNAEPASDHLRREPTATRSPSSPCEATSNWTTSSMTSVKGSTAPKTSSINGQQTISEADDIISEFLGQINAKFEATSTLEHKTSCMSQQAPLGGTRYPSDTGSTSQSTLKPSPPPQVIPSPAVSNNLHFPVVSDRTASQVPSYRHFFNNKGPEVDRIGEVQRPMVYRPTFSGYGALGDFEMPTPVRIGSDIATGPAAETLKKMAAMHRSMYEKSNSLPSSDMTSWSPYHGFPASGFNGGRNAMGQYVEYGKVPAYHQHSQHRQQQQLPPPYDVTKCSPAFGHNSSLPLQSSSALPNSSYNNNNNGAMKPLSHYPDLISPVMTSSAGSATSGAAVGGNTPPQSSHFRRLQQSPDRFVRMTQRQHVTIQQNFHAAGGRHEAATRQNGTDQRFHVEATQSQRVQIRVGPESPSPYSGLVPPLQQPIAEHLASFWKPEVYPHFDCHVPKNGPNPKVATDSRWLRQQQQTPAYGSSADASADVAPFCGGSDASSFVSGVSIGVTTGELRHDRERYHLHDHQPTMVMTVGGGQVAPLITGRPTDRIRTGCTTTLASGLSEQHSTENSSSFRRGYNALKAVEQAQYGALSANLADVGANQMGLHQASPSEYASTSPSLCSAMPNGDVMQHQFEHRYPVHQHHQVQRWNSLPVPLNSAHSTAAGGDTNLRCGTLSLVQSPYGVMDFRSCEDDVIDMVPLNAGDFLPGSCFDRTATAVVSSAEGSTSSTEIAVSSSNGASFIDEIFGNR